MPPPPPRVRGSALKVQSGVPWEGCPLCGGALGPVQPEILPPGGHGRGSPRTLCPVAGLWVPLGCCPSSHAFSPLSTAHCSAGICFNGGHCITGSAQLCYCPRAFQGPRCQYGEWTVGHSPLHRPAPVACLTFLVEGQPWDARDRRPARRHLRAPLASRGLQRDGWGLPGVLGSWEVAWPGATKQLSCRAGDPGVLHEERRGGMLGPTGGGWFGETGHLCKSIRHGNPSTPPALEQKPNGVNFRNLIGFIN